MKNFIILIVLLSTFFLACDRDDHEAHEETSYIVTKPLLTDTLIYHEYVGQIHSIQHIKIRTLEKGYLQKIYVDEGQAVRKGQLLFQIMPVIYQSEMLKNQAEVSFAEIEYRNTKALADSNIVSRNELALAKAKLDKAKAELALAEAHLGFTEIRATFDGMIGRFNEVRLGSLLDEGELLTTLSDNSKMWVYFNVPEAEYLDYASRPKSDSLLKVRLQLANNRMFNEHGIVETIEADFNNETGNIAFRATFRNPTGILRNGETGNVLLPVPLEQVLIIPQKATFEILDKKYVYVVDKEGKVESREIRTGAEMPHLYTVVSGIKPGEQILVEGLRKVRNGDKIHTKYQALSAIMDELKDLHAE
ncbi:MAG: efflux RND transporter periplasmic adaptor subunit [Flavobacteriales bacterium]|nr:efflux RND transporter periplasmic adaptor subunit [Flavobacteriales bacterium]